MQGQTPNRLAELRRQHGSRLIDVATVAGKDQSLIYRYEQGETQIPDDVKAKLAAYFGVSRAYLMGWDEPVGDEPSGVAA